MAEFSDFRNKKLYKIYSIQNYNQANNDFIKKNYKELSLDKINKELTLNDKNYHFRIKKDETYVFFGDLDDYSDGINYFNEILINYMKENYNVNIKQDDIKYTENDIKPFYYHYSIPKLNCNIKKLKEIHNNLKNYLKNKNNIDTTIYSDHWYRCPNQSKGIENDKGKHEIKNGKMKDFILEYIPKYSKNIDNVNYVLENNKQIINYKKEQEINEEIIDIKQNENNQLINRESILSTTMTRPEIYKKVFDECYKQERFEVYEYWISVGMAIKNTFEDEREAYELFNYYSAKGTNYDGYDNTIRKYKTFIKKYKMDGHTIATIYYYAIEDNKPKFIEIMSKNTLELQEADFCKYLKTLSGYKFIYKVFGENNYKLYCYNGKYWQNDDTIMRKSISTELYNFLKMVLIEIYWNAKEFNILKSKIEKLKTISLKRNIIESYKEIGVNNEIKFDNKWWLLGFTNGVYDMNEGIFRDYRYDDYISLTTGYDWKEPSEDEITIMNTLIDRIMPIKEEKELYLQILCTALEGRCLEKCIILNGNGRNGKGMINDILLAALGSYGLIGNNAILFECSKTGSNPEKANLHKKRLVIFREPPEKRKFENAIIKELTGGGSFSARTLHEKETEKELNATIIIECNKKPLFSEEPTNAELYRLIDLYFRSTFVTDKNEINENKYIYLANLEYKTNEFKSKYKYALLKILMNEHKKYIINKSVFNIPESVKERTKQYLELSCNIVQWFKDHYKYVNDSKEFCKIKDVYDNFIKSEYYQNLTKNERRRYNKSFFVDYIEKNIFFKNYYYEKYNKSTNIIKNWKIKEEIDFIIE